MEEKIENMTKNPDAPELQEVINKLNALSTGTIEKFRIIHLLRDGEKSYTSIQKIFPTTNKSTIYKYLDDLFSAKIIKKRIDKPHGSRPLAYYSLSSLSLDLSPASISKILGYANVQENTDNTKIVLSSEISELKELKVIGKDNRETKFYPSILLGDLLDAGLRVDDAIFVLNSVFKSLYSGITTTEIGEITIENLKNIDNKLADMFKKFIEPHLNVVVDSKIEVWDRDKISEMIKKRRRVKELSATELNFLSHKIIRNIKKLTTEPSKELVEAYISMLADTVI